MVYDLAVSVYGKGILAPSHWSIAIYQPGHVYGDLFQVKLLDPTTGRFLHDHRSAALFVSQSSEGRCTVAMLTNEQRVRVIDVLQSEPAPVGRGNCQDWCVNALIALEAEELVPPGTSSLWSSLVGKPALDLEVAVGQAWQGA